MIRFRTALVAFAAGATITLPVAVSLEWAWTRLALRWVGWNKFEMVEWAGWTVDPFIEELVRLIPLFTLLHFIHRCREQWSLTAIQKDLNTTFVYRDWPDVGPNGVLPPNAPQVSLPPF